MKRPAEPVTCDWNGCSCEPTRELRFGRVETQKLALVARYCDEHAAEVQAMFFVESDVELARDDLAGLRF